ncbi:hypothetical protein C0993_000403 [Termitomyces sp. T159_Od127]|nr:hypothetical protein C0993_000403 [Termitomyces sp. T159_Od127]
MDYKAERALDLFVDAAADVEPPRPTTGLKHHWFCRNAASIDGIPGMLTAQHFRTTFLMPERLAITKRERIHHTKDAAWLKTVDAAVDFKLVATSFASDHDGASPEPRESTWQLSKQWV